jgi:hypothetical protein
MQDSKEKTILVDGVERPRENWKGEPLAQTDEDITKFWKSFAGSKFVDDKGRPMSAAAWMDRQEEALGFDEDVFKPRAAKITAFDLDNATSHPAPSIPGVDAGADDDADNKPRSKFRPR